MPQPPAPDLRHFPRWHRASAAERLVIAGVVGVVVTIATLMIGSVTFAPMIGWDAAAAVFLLWTWLTIWPHGPESTRQLATREDPTRTLMDVVLLGASLVSLVAVGAALFGAGHAGGAEEIVRVALGVVSIALSWAVVQSVFCLKYASLYYGDEPGGIDFSAAGDPAYADFAYLAFTVGMTYQVSDTAVTASVIRRVVLRHSLVSFLFGTVILASTINLVSGLSR